MAVVFLFIPRVDLVSPCITGTPLSLSRQEAIWKAKNKTGLRMTTCAYSFYPNISPRLQFARSRMRCKLTDLWFQYNK